MSDATSGDVHRVLKAVHDVQGFVQQIDAKVEIVTGQVDTVQQLQAETRSDLAQLRDEFLSFVRQAELTANVQRAETRLGVLQDELEHAFGNHKVVRSSAVGMLQAFDVGLVSQETVRSISEQLMVQTPRYWLAPALVALSAWSGDDQELCRKATDEAFRRSPSRTSLFFALVLRRQGRQASAVRWLKHYLQAQDPAALGREFAVILEAVAQGAFGPAGRELISETLDDWGSVLAEHPDAQRAQVERWKHEVRRYTGPASSGDFPRLASVSPQWKALERSLASAEGHALLSTHYAALLAAETPASSRIEDAADDILDRLVSEYDPEELPLRRELVKVQAVISNGGDMAASAQQADVEVTALDETLDYLTVQSTAALQPADLGLSAATQKLSIAACAGWFRTAHDETTRDYRAGVPSDVQAELGGGHTVGAQVFQLPDWRGSFTTPMPDLERNLEQHWERHTAPFLASLEFDLKKALIVPGIAAVVALFVVVSSGSVGLLLVALVAGAAWAYKINRDKQMSEANYAQAVEVLARAKTDSVAQLRGAGAELTDWTSRYAGADARDTEVQQMITDFGRSAEGGNPFERRVVGV